MTPRRGFTLLELLCVMGFLAVIGVLLTLLLKETLTMERLQAESFDKALQANALADQFRADVAQAETAPKDWQQFHAGADTLILQSNQFGHIVYAWRDGTLARHVLDGNKVSRHDVLTATGRGSVEFVRPDAEPKLIRLRLHALREGRPLAGQALEIAAALGGDWR